MPKTTGQTIITNIEGRCLKIESAVLLQPNKSYMGNMIYEIEGLSPGISEVSMINTGA